MIETSLEEIWELENGKKKNTKDLLEQLYTQQIDENTLSWNERCPDTKTLKARFPLIGPYGIIRSISEGAFGQVCLAIHCENLFRGLETPLLALKYPTPSLLKNYAEMAYAKDDIKEGVMLARLEIGQFFSKEAVLTANLSMSPYVVTVVDHQISYPYIVFEYCDGGTLSDRYKKPYEKQDIYQWGYEIAAALVASHGLRPNLLIHRDLKPSNVLVHKSSLKVSDFGTSQLVCENETLRSIKSGYTTAYAAPEVFEEKTYPATDIWSLGVMLYEMVSCKTPFRRIREIEKEEPQNLKDLDSFGLEPGFFDFVQACLAKNPHDRPDAKECLHILGKWNPSYKSSDTERLFKDVNTKKLEAILAQKKKKKLEDGFLH